MRLRHIQLDEEARLRLRVMDAYARMESKNVTELCRLFGVSRSWFYKWRGQYRPSNLQTLKTKSRRPKHVKSIPWDVVVAVCAWKRAHPTKSHYYLYQTWLKEGQEPHCSPKTIYNIWKRRGLIQERRRKRRALPLLHAAHHPGELVQVDTKHLGGCYQYTAIDRCSRWRYLRLYATATMKESVDFLQHLLEVAPFPIQLVQTDNGPEFQSAFVDYLRRHGISHQYTWIHTPDQNGCVERSHRTDEEEFYDQTPWRGLQLAELNRKIQAWADYYNERRLHYALGYKTPMEYLQCH
jgi:transposase InsO family protein